MVVIMIIPIPKNKSTIKKKKNEKRDVLMWRVGNDYSGECVEKGMWVALSRPHTASRLYLLVSTNKQTHLTLSTTVAFFVIFVIMGCQFGNIERGRHREQRKRHMHVAYLNGQDSFLPIHPPSDFLYLNHS